MEPIEKDSPTVNSEEEIEGISNDEYQKIFKVQSRKSKAKETKKETKKETSPSAPAPAPVPPTTPAPTPQERETPKPEAVKEAPKENPTEKPEEKKEVKKRGRKELPADQKKPKPPHPFTQIKMVKEEVENLKKQLQSGSQKPQAEIKTPQEPKINPDEFERKHGSTGYSKKEIEDLRREVEELKRPKHGIDALSEKQRKLWEMMRN